MSLSTPVLVLNKFWAPVDVTSIAEAITKLWKTCESGAHIGQPKARIIDPNLDFQTFSWDDWAAIAPIDGDVCIRGITQNYRIFDVIQLTEYDKQPTQRLHFSRRTIWRRDGMHCQYCNVKCTEKPGNEGTIDHVIPKAQGGKTTWENCVLACVTCNAQKADRTPEQATKPTKKGKSVVEWRGPSPMRLLSIPKKPRLTILKGDRKHMRDNWKHFISEAYWNVELQNDNSSL
jgi:5-methylcytosine-specific restriction endonuclease McrA